MTVAAKNIVIIGGGFAGVNAAKQLQGRLPTGWNILLFSQENHIVFTPLLGSVVGSSINPMHIVFPARQMLKSVDCRTAAIAEIDLVRKEIVYEISAVQTARQPFNHLVLATGSTINFDIIPGMAAHGWPLKTVGDALALRSHLIGLLEHADVETNAEVKRRLLSIVVVGGGFSGIGVAGELFDFLRSSCQFYTHVDPAELRVTVLEAQQRILPELPESLSVFALKKLQQRGIDVRVNALAAAATERAVLLKDGSQIDTATVICTIGITAAPLVTNSGLPMERTRIKTTPEMRVQGFDNVWAVGDCAAILNAHDQKISPTSAPFAINQAKQLARNIISVIGGQPAKPFSFHPKGMIASIGRHKAVAQVLGVKVSGLMAWLLWRGVHLHQMPTVARKAQIAFDWLWQLFFSRDIVQLNLQPTERFGKAHFEAGQFVFHRGEPADRFYIIQRGSASVLLDEDGPPVNVLKKGNHFGEAALLGSSPRSASVRADEPLDVLTMSRTSFNQLTGGLQVLRTALEQSFERRQSLHRFLEWAKGQPRLHECRVGEVMSKPAVTLPVSLTLAEALSRSRETAMDAFPIVDEGDHLVGICTRSNFYQAVLQLRPQQTPMKEIMDQPVITIGESESLGNAQAMFLREPIKRLVVVADADATRVIGILTPFDMLSFLAEDSAELFSGIAST